LWIVSASSTPQPLNLSSTLFFFHCSGAHRALPSFPTRRSSDLASLALTAYGLGAVSGRVASGIVSDRIGTFTTIRLGYALQLVRSEEHTSELQSRFDLVCRLLLEKKKNKEKQTISNNVASSCTS